MTWDGQGVSHGGSQTTATNDLELADNVTTQELFRYRCRLGAA
jgi:hypothetical protein